MKKIELDKYAGLKMKMYKCIDDKYGIIYVIGLFIPMPISNHNSLFKKSKYGWCFTITVGMIPLGWPMIAVALIF